ncbi:hypothetical protein K438DRAFT_1782951 [Mycena galopus ATCC 62051]|nr:hypothetical protein K438DRAFT_1782951 [Mycena galopus ATCC 62051]
MNSNPGIFVLSHFRSEGYPYANWRYEPTACHRYAGFREFMLGRLLVRPNITYLEMDTELNTWISHFKLTSKRVRLYQMVPGSSARGKKQTMSDWSYVPGTGHSSRKEQPLAGFIAERKNAETLFDITKFWGGRVFELELISSLAAGGPKFARTL